jgi:hypothetical protein
MIAALLLGQIARSKWLFAKQWRGRAAKRAELGALPNDGPRAGGDKERLHVGETDDQNVYSIILLSYADRELLRCPSTGTHGPEFRGNVMAVARCTQIVN